MVCRFERKKTPKSYCLSIVLRKAFDTVKWKTILTTLSALRILTMVLKAGNRTGNDPPDYPIIPII